MESKKVFKSRDIRISELYSILQQEYISYMLRSKLYPKPYSAKYSGYCKLKKEKIDKIALRGCLPSIFNSDKTYKKYLDSVIKEFGLPDFQYRDQKSREIMGFYDRMYFFKEGNEVEFIFNSVRSKGFIYKNFPNKNKVIIKISGKDFWFDYQSLSRINTEEFLSLI